MKIRPLHDYVIVRRAEEAHLSEGGIVIPDTAAEKPEQGEVVGVGKGSLLAGGKLVPLSVTVGDKVLFGKYSGTEINLENEALLVMHESDILAALDL